MYGLEWEKLKWKEEESYRYQSQILVLKPRDSLRRKYHLDPLFSLNRIDYWTITVNISPLQSTLDSSLFNNSSPWLEDAHYYT